MILSLGSTTIIRLLIAKGKGEKEMIGVNIIMALVAALVGFWLGTLAADN